jgi:hypothetical protein
MVPPPIVSRISQTQLPSGPHSQQPGQPKPLPLRPAPQAKPLPLSAPLPEYPTGRFNPTSFHPSQLAKLEPSSLELTDPTFGGRLPPLSSKEIEDVKGWTQKEAEYLGIVEEEKSKMGGWMERLKEREKAEWWEKEKDDVEGAGGKRKKGPEGTFEVIWPGMKRRRKEEIKLRQAIRL